MARWGNDTAIARTYSLNKTQLIRWVQGPAPWLQADTNRATQSSQLPVCICIIINSERH